MCGVVETIRRATADVATDAVLRFQGGDVVCCDGCRAVYHLACIDLAALPSDDFFCPLCSCKQCKGPCNTPHPAFSIQTETVPVHTKTLKVGRSRT